MIKAKMLICLLLLTLICKGQTLSYGWHHTSDNKNSATNTIIATRIVGDTLFTIGQFNKDSLDANPGVGVDWLVNVNGADAPTYTTIYVSKFLINGTYLNSFRLMETPNNIDIADFEIDQFHDIVVIGTVDSGVDFDPSSIAVGTSEITSTEFGSFIAIYKANGVYNYHGEFAPTGTVVYPVLYDAVIDEKNNLYVTGSYTGTLDVDFSAFGTDIRSSRSDIFDAIMIKIDLNTGLYKWCKEINGLSGDVYGKKIVEKNGIIAILGGFTDLTIDLDPGVGTSNKTKTSTYEATFITVLDENANYINGTIFGGTLGNIFPVNIQLDKDSSIYVLEQLYSQNEIIDLDYGVGTSLVNTSFGPYGCVFVAKFDKDFLPKWNKTIAGNKNYTASFGKENLAVGKNHLVISGVYDDCIVNFGDVDSNKNIDTAKSYYNMFITSLDKATGNLYSHTVFNGNPDTSGFIQNNELQLDTNDNIYGSGFFSERIDFNPFDKIIIYDSTKPNGILNYLTRINYSPITTTIKENNTLQSQIKIYPNPSEGIISIESENPILELLVSDFAGRLVEKQEPNKKATMLNFSNKASGTYLLLITDAKGLVSHRTVVKK